MNGFKVKNMMAICCFFCTFAKIKVSEYLSINNGRKESTIHYPGDNSLCRGK